jgi:sigma-B regulation protein RsbU (phosphoserine phosphatase)
VDSSGPPVGWHRDPRFVSATHALAAGDVLVAYTDGLTEARAGSRLLGEEVVRSALREVAGADADTIAAHLHGLLAQPGVDARDDAAAVVLKVR